MDTLSRDTSSWTHAKAGLVAFGVLLIFLVILFSVVVPDGRKANDRDRQQLYTAWSKVHPETQLTYAEWSNLYRANLLPGQDRR